MKVKRDVILKNMNVIGENGNVEWPMREATILACLTRQPKIPGSEKRAAISGDSKLGTTNQKRVKSFIVEEPITPQEDRTEIGWEDR